MSRIGIVAAMDCERRTLTRSRIPVGEILETPEGVLLGVSGAGTTPAMSLAARLVERRVDHLLSWGLAGALVSDLEPGALILPSYVIGSDGRRHRVDQTWRTKALRALGNSPAHGAPLAESRSALLCRARKQALHNATGAVAVDMESGGVARVAEDAGVPFLCLRVIADRLGNDIPAWAPDHLSNPGGWKTVTLARQAVCSPRDWGALLVLSLALARALGRLRRVVPVILTDARPTNPVSEQWA